MSDNVLEIPFSGEDGKHPIAIAAGYNPMMKRYDLQITVGNFQNEAAAKRYADIVADFLRETANAEMLKAQ